MRNGATSSGKVYFNDEVEVSQKSYGSVGGYVMQDDIIFEHFTVKEALTFAARLRLKGSVAEQNLKVNDLLRDLGLWSVRDSQVGSITRKVISGGERKRTAIGVELITDPSVIFLDEPTSGLDSFKALQIVLQLKRLARQQGKTIISTIHQPNSIMLSFFDRLILMSDGHIVYQGEALKSADHFRSQGYNISRFSNPVDTYMKILSVTGAKSAEEKQKMKEKIDKMVAAYERDLSAGIEELSNSVKLDKFDVKNHKSNGPWIQF